MYQQLLKRIRTSAVAVSVLKRHGSWTQGDGPNYSKNLIAIGIATTAGVMFSMVSIQVLLMILLGGEEESLEEVNFLI